jgi:nitronate monooxygenase
MEYLTTNIFLQRTRARWHNVGNSAEAATMGTALTDLLDLALPVIQAPMAGVSTPALAAAVSDAGGLGSIAVGAMSAEAADDSIRDAMARTGAPLNVNVFVHPRPPRDAALEAAWIENLRPCFAAVHAEPPKALEEIYPTLDDCPPLLEILLERRPPVVSLHFGLPSRATLKALRDAGICLIGNATSVAEARLLQAADMDVIVAQGYEAGGHRGTFATGEDARLSTFALVPQIVAAVDVPVVAAGGLRTGQDIATAIDLGACGGQLGTAFVECPESAAAPAYRAALRAPDLRTVMTAVFSGRPARGLANRLVRELSGREHRVPAYPVAYDAAKRLAAAAVAADSNEFTAMWAGDGPMRPEPLPAAALVAALGRELAAASTR